MKTLTWDQFTSNVQQWADERGIYEYSTSEAQLLKTVSELGELADAIIKNDIHGIRDGVGDVAVCLVNASYFMDIKIDEPLRGSLDTSTVSESIGDILIDMGVVINSIKPIDGGFGARMGIASIMHDLFFIASYYDLSLMDCCKSSWLEIKDRKGKVVAGGAFVKEG